MLQKTFISFYTVSFRVKCAADIITSLHRRAQDITSAASYWLCRVAPRLSESVVQGVTGAKPAMHRGLARRVSTLLAVSATDFSVFFASSPGDVSHAPLPYEHSGRP